MAIYHLIKEGVRVKITNPETQQQEEFKAQLIDWKAPENNDFLVVNQMKYHGSPINSIPDLVVYINGLPIGVIECKSPVAQNTVIPSPPYREKRA